jgi:hypothetical protein
MDTHEETSTVEWVTPLMAAEWLKSNTRNRVMVKSRVEGLAKEIKAGAWRVTHQGIAFGKDGTLFDGQHRLQAIVQAGITIPIMVTRGLADQSLDAIDTGSTRMAADVLAIADGKHVSRVKRSSVLAAMTIVHHGGIRGIIAKTTVSHLRRSLALFEPNFDALNLSMQNNRLAQAPVFGAMLVCHALHPSDAVEFAKVYRDPSGVTSDHPAAAFRDHVLLHYVTGSTRQRADVIARAFGAFHAYRNQMTRKHIRAARVTMLAYVNAWRAKHGMEPLGSDDDNG